MSISLKFFIAIIALTPFITEFRLGSDYFYSESSLLKLTVSSIGLLFSLLLFLITTMRNKGAHFYYIKPFMPAALFVAWSFVTLFWVNDYILAGELLVQFVVYVVGLVLAVNLIRNIEHLKLLLIWIVVSLVGVSIIGLIQYYFPNNDLIQHMFLQTAVPGSTFVNKNMASHFLVMTIPVSIGLLLAENTRYKVFVYGVSTAIGSWFLIYTVARQAYVAITIEVLLLLLFFAVDYFKNSSQSLLNIISLKKTKYTTLIAVVLFLIFASNFTNTGWNTGNVKLDRIQGIASDDNNPRIPAWVNTIDMIKDHPLTGVGIGQWSVKYPAYYDKSMKDVIFNEKTRAKKLHNDYLEMFANVGMIGYIFLLWLALLVIRRSWSILKNPLNLNRIYYLSITLGMVGFSIVAFFSFPIGVHYPALLLFVYLGLLWFEDGREALPVKSKYFQYLSIFAVVVTLLLTSVYSYKYLFSKHYARLANEYAIHNDFSNDYKLLAKSLELMPESWISNQSLGRLLLVNNQPKNAIPYLLKAKSIKPYHSFSLLNLARAFEKSGDNTSEREVLESLVDFDQKNVRAWGRLTQIYVKNGNKNKANAAYKNMKIYFEYFKNRSGFGPYYDVAIGVSKYVGEYRYAAYVYNHLIETQPFANNYVNYAVFVDKYLNDKLRSRELLIKALELDPEFIMPNYIKENYDL
jgi:O-antigen ligase